MARKSLACFSGGGSSYDVTELPSRFQRKILAVDGCWLWQGWTEKRAPGKLCYGKVWWEGTMRYAHRIVWQLLVGDIPDGMQFDHVKQRGCVGPQCVNPAHLEPVTSRENVRRGNAGKNMLARITCHCGMCLTCRNRQYMRNHRARKKAVNG